MSSKILTVTVPCFNSQDYLEKCIDSLLTGKEKVEIIIVNDGSNDKTGEIADSYKAKYPEIVKVIHQENGGHGEGINQGIAHATGKFFKVVDSDDWVSEDFPRFLEMLEKYENEKSPDLVVTNYYYEHADGKKNRSICYSNVFDENKVIGWEDTRPFRLHQLITIHSSTFRTQLFKKHMKTLPKHVFYEDNLMVYQIIPYVENILYLNMDLYRYFIGREGQSVQRDVMMRRYEHQLIVTESCFKVCHIDDIKSPKLKKYSKHVLFMMFGIAVMFTRLRRDKVSDERLEKMWSSCMEFDRKWAAKYRRQITLWLMCMSGRAGYVFTELMYYTANRIVRFNE